MGHLAWKHHQLSSERKKPWYGVEKGRRRQGPFFFLLHAAKVRSSCEEGPGQTPKLLDVTELKQNRTSKVQAKNCNQPN